MVTECTWHKLWPYTEKQHSLNCTEIVEILLNFYFIIISIVSSYIHQYQTQQLTQGQKGVFSTDPTRLPTQNMICPYTSVWLTLSVCLTWPVQEISPPLHWLSVWQTRNKIWHHDTFVVVYNVCKVIYSQVRWQMSQGDTIQLLGQTTRQDDPSTLGGNNHLMYDWCLKFSRFIYLCATIQFNTIFKLFLSYI